MEIFAESFVTPKGEWRVVADLGCDEAHYVNLWTDETGSISVASDGSSSRDSYMVSFLGLASFRLCFARRQICVLPSDSGHPDFTLQHLLADQIAPRIIAHEGGLVIHAGAVELDGDGIALLGASGRGKSTLAASFHQVGARLLGDDAIILTLENGVTCAKAVYRSLRLLPDSIASLFSVWPDLSSVAHYTEKQRVAMPLEADQKGRQTTLKALFFLGPHSDDESNVLRRMSSAETCMGLLENSFWLDPTDLVGARLKMETASEVANRTAAFELSYPRDYAKIAAVHDAIKRQLASLPDSPVKAAQHP